MFPDKIYILYYYFYFMVNIADQVKECLDQYAKQHDSKEYNKLLKDLEKYNKAVNDLEEFNKSLESLKKLDETLKLIEKYPVKSTDLIQMTKPYNSTPLTNYLSSQLILH